MNALAKYPVGTIVCIVRNARLRSAVSRCLERDGFEVVHVAAAGAILGLKRVPEAVLLDTLGDIAMVRWSFSGPVVAVGFLHSDSHWEDAIFEGADDYFPIPFSTFRLSVCIHTSSLDLRATNLLVFDDIVVDLRERLVRRANRLVNLTAKERELLATLIRRPRAVHTFAELMDTIWPHTDIKLGTIHTTVCMLRAKMNAGGEPNVIETVHGFGYRIGKQNALPLRVGRGRDFP